MPCETCGFDDSLWDEVQVETTLLSAPYLAAGLEIDEAFLPPPNATDPEAAHVLLHAMHLAGRARHAETATATGTVVQLSTSGGGVPKLPVDEVRIAARGVSGDAQEDRRNHGRPWQAVCLWAAEVVERLQAEGHPISFGSAGENVTVRGLDWAAVTPGARLQVGEALLEVSAYAIPCSKNARWFSDGGFNRMSQVKRPGGSRVYASVVRAGAVRTGDPVVLEP